jgi:hypothetical protein
MSKRGSQPKLNAMIPCGYCFSEWATCYDHIKPVSFGGTNRRDNLYPACQRCNGILSGKVFDSLGEKRDYLRQVLIQRNKWVENPSLMVPDGESGFVYGVSRCQECGEILQAQTSKKKFCNDKCRYTHRNKHRPRLDLDWAINHLKERYVTPREAEALGFGTAKEIRAKIRRKELPSIRMFGRVLLNKVDVKGK